MIINVKFTSFQRSMKKPVFTLAEAEMVAHASHPQGLRLNFHRWVRKGLLQRLRRGVYFFPERQPSLTATIEHLYPPAYISLESALNRHGILPDVPFETLLVTPRPTRRFHTPWGRFRFHHIDPRLFFGYDPDSLLAEPEKAVLDYFHLRGAALQESPAFWREARFDNLEILRWTKGRDAAQKYPAERVLRLWESLHRYAKASRPH